MKYVDEYRDPEIAHSIAGPIARQVTQPWVLMEVCGGQTHTLMRAGIDELLPRELNLSMDRGVQYARHRLKCWTARFELHLFRA